MSQHFIAIALLNDALDAAIEPVAVLIGQVLRDSSSFIRRLLQWRPG
jgi:hypothetical protein